MRNIYERATKPVYRPIAEYEQAADRLGGNVVVDMFEQEAAQQAAERYYQMRLSQIHRAKQKKMRVQQ